MVRLNLTLHLFVVQSTSPHRLLPQGVHHTLLPGRWGAARRPVPVRAEGSQLTCAQHQKSAKIVGHHHKLRWTLASNLTRWGWASSSSSSYMNMNMSMNMKMNSGGVQTVKGTNIETLRANLPFQLMGDRHLLDDMMTYIFACRLFFGVQVSAYLKPLLREEFPLLETPSW